MTPHDTIMRKPLHIGIVACSAEGAALCYRTICTEGTELLGPQAHPEVSLHSASLAEYVHMDELVYGIFKPQGVVYFQQVIQNLMERGCDAVILGVQRFP